MLQEVRAVAAYGIDRHLSAFEPRKGSFCSRELNYAISDTVRYRCALP